MSADLSWSNFEEAKLLRAAAAAERGDLAVLREMAEDEARARADREWLTGQTRPEAPGG